MCSLIFRRIPIEVCLMTTTARARLKMTNLRRVDGVAPYTKIGGLITAEHKILNVENEARCGHKNALIVQDDLTNWIQTCPMKTKDTLETMSCLR